MGISREVWDLRDSTPPNKEKPFQIRKTLSKQGKTPPNKENPFKQGKPFPDKETPFQTRKNTNKQGKPLSSKGYLPIKCKSLQVVGVSGQGKAVVSDGG